VNDWRYKRERDGIVTLFFEAKHQFGKPCPDDDIEEVRWFKPAALSDENLVEGHVPLFEQLLILTKLRPMP